MKPKTKKLLLSLASHLVFLTIIAVLWHARVYVVVSPFALALLFASIYIRLNPFAVAGGTFVLSLLTGTEHGVVLGNLFAVLVFIAWAMIAKKKNQWWIAILSFIVAHGVIVYNFENIYLGLISVLIGSVFLFNLIILIKAVKERKGKIPWTIDQKICLCVFVVVFALGLGGMDSDYFSTHKFVTILAILIGTFWFSGRNTLIIAVCLGLGRSLLALNLNFVAIYALLALVTVAFKSKRPYMSIIALIVMDVVLGTFFDAYIVYNIFSLIPMFLAVGVFLALPRKIVTRLDMGLWNLNTDLVSKNTINQNRNLTHRRLQDLSQVFSEMGGIYKKTIRGEMSIKENADLISGQVVANLHLPLTHTELEAVKVGVRQMVETGLVRGQVTLLDVPAILNMKQFPLTPFVNEINRMIGQTVTRKQRDKVLNSSKLLMAQLMEGVGALCEDFAKQTSGQVVYDNEKATRIKEDLLFRNVVVADALITRSGVNQYTVSLLVSNTDASNLMIEKIVSKVCGHPVAVDNIQYATTAGFAIISMKTAPRFSLVYGVAQVAKGYAQLSGDSYSVLKVNSERILTAISDGMGTGERAKLQSTLSLSLIENFYKAGFPSNVIMNSVNQLLTITGGEVFSALDIAVFNLVVGEVTFIKLGGVEGYIKHERETEMVESGSLPLGVLEDIKPKVSTAMLQHGDYVVLLSDGILEAFAGDRLGLGSYINNLNPKTPQELADEILNEALNRQSRQVGDDSTVLVVKIEGQQIKKQFSIRSM
ncbi:MAG: SpoIIE family protein phosphatase [Firmicutes bacterium]|nr:SpoIIE family protein phosphatase [Bacillota bacterium]